MWLDGMNMIKFIIIILLNQEHNCWKLSRNSPSSVGWLMMMIPLTIFMFWLTSNRRWNWIRERFLLLVVVTIMGLTLSDFRTQNLGESSREYLLWWLSNLNSLSSHSIMFIFIHNDVAFHLVGIKAVSESRDENIKSNYLVIWHL